MARVIKGKPQIKLAGNSAEMLSSIRQTYNILNATELNDWVSTLPDVKDTNGNNEQQKFTFRYEALPDAIKNLFSLIFEVSSLKSKDELRFTEITVIKPRTKTTKRINGEFHLNEFTNSMMNVTDRFLYVFGKEQIGYKSVDISAVSQQFGMGGGMQLPPILEQTSKTKIYHLNNQSALSTKIIYDDGPSFRPPSRPGFRDADVRKSPERWGMIIDVYGNKDRLDDMVEEKLKPIQEIIDGPANSKKAKLIKKFGEDLQMQKNEEESTKAKLLDGLSDDEDVEDVEDVEIPELVPDICGTEIDQTEVKTGMKDKATEASPDDLQKIDNCLQENELNVEELNL